MASQPLSRSSSTKFGNRHLGWLLFAVCCLLFALAEFSQTVGAGVINIYKHRYPFYGYGPYYGHHGGYGGGFGGGYGGFGINLGGGGYGR